MCGFAGIHNIGANVTESPEPILLKKMAERIMHRGPDEAGLYVDQELGFSHRRLSIIDIESGQQPMRSDDGQIVMVFNGGIFNFVELRQDLEKEGVNFKTKSDTEVILELYRLRGLDFVQKLNGQFAIALWDRRVRTLYLIRDRIGICPLFYTVNNGRFIFGSEIKALTPALTAKPSIDLKSLDQIFTFWAPISPNTIFEGVREVSPGQIISVASGEVRSSRYWDWPITEARYSNAPESELADELHDLLVDATQIRLRSDVPVGAYLSGGLDSSAIVSMILNHTNTSLRTFSLTFEDKGFDESEFQSALVDHVSVLHSSLAVDSDMIGVELERTTWHTETPILRTAPVPMGMLSRHVRRAGYKVVLTGEGADEVLGGYDLFKETKVRQFLARQPESVTRPLLLKRIYPYLVLPNGKDAQYLKMFFGMGIDSPNDPCFSHMPRWRTTGKAKNFFSDAVTSTIASNTAQRYSKQLSKLLERVDYFNRAQYIESKTLMSGYLLSSQGDRMLMMNSVEGRFPFLDHRVIEFSSTLPPTLKMKVLNEKYLLKRAVGKYLPDAIVNRHKQPYRAPDLLGFGTSRLDTSIFDALSEKQINRVGFFDSKKVGLLQKKAASRGRLSISESQTITGIITTQFVHDQFC
jgi:asparagine synthase (glutamine-hydrolysing)